MPTAGDVDIIRDFTRGQDKLMFESYSFSISALDPVEVNGYSTGATGVGINVLVYDPTSGYLYVDPDVSNGIVGATALCQFENYAGISELDSSDWATY